MSHHKKPGGGAASVDSDDKSKVLNKLKADSARAELLAKKASMAAEVHSFNDSTPF
jgi:hypothetical protein